MMAHVSTYVSDGDDRCPEGYVQTFKPTSGINDFAEMKCLIVV